MIKFNQAGRSRGRGRGEGGKTNCFCGNRKVTEGKFWRLFARLALARSTRRCADTRPRARCVAGSRRRGTKFFAPRRHAWPRVRTGVRGAPSVGRVRAALLQGAREGALPARPARGLCARLGGHRCSLIHATATLGRWACMRATRAARRMRSKLNRTRS